MRDEPLSHAPDNVDEPSDDELARRLLEEDPGSPDGEAFLLVYARHRDAVREAMQAAGLSFEQAERRVGAVFDRLLTRPPEAYSDTPLRTWLERIAREVAASAARSAPEKPRSEALPSRIGKDGFFGSGMW